MFWCAKIAPYRNVLVFKINEEIVTPGISNIMPLRRFEQLFRCFHLANNANQIPYGQPGHDKLFKVRSLLDIIVPRFVAECEGMYS